MGVSGEISMCRFVYGLSRFELGSSTATDLVLRAYASRGRAK